MLCVCYDDTRAAVAVPVRRLSTDSILIQATRGMDDGNVWGSSFGTDVQRNILHTFLE